VAETCVVCGNAPAENARFVLVRGRRQQVYCSEACLRGDVHKRRTRRRALWRWWSLRLGLAAAVLLGAFTLWQRFRVPSPESISYAWPDVHGEKAPPPGPFFYGPPWPPTDEQWIAAFNKEPWIYPLPGPSRRPVTIDGRMFGVESPRDFPALCRKEGRCGVDLGGELWGEHVYAAHDGVVERVQENGHDQHGGQYVRLAHFGGMVFTQYFHLAAVPRGIHRGTRVMAGQVIGLVGDTGIEGERRHLHFTLSIRPSKEYAEIYWDPTPFMVRWPLRLPPNGTVAGFTPHP
jgi:hypothetical protein